MSYNILAVNPGHNGSICFLKDGKLDVYIEEERLTRAKYDGNPLRAIQHIINKDHVDLLVLGGTSGQMYPQMTWSGEDPFSALVRKFNPKIKIVAYFDYHHLGHAASAFYNSGFDSAAAIVVDGSGSYLKIEDVENTDGVTNSLEGFETETIFKFCSPASFEVHYQSIGQSVGGNYILNEGRTRVTGTAHITKAYEAVTDYCGFPFIEAGKLMGLASYGGPNENIPDLFYGENSNRNVFVPMYPAGAKINVDAYPQLITEHMKETGARRNDLKQVAKSEKDLKLLQDFAWKIQQDTQKLVGDLIEKAIDLTGETNIVLAGGYGLNCVANYYYKKRFPNINFFVDPVSHDGGTSIGLAKFAWHQYCVENDIEFENEPLKTLYLGIDRNDEINLENCEGFTITNVTVDDVAKLISEQNIVSLFNGAAEAGPRALGNRSILFDPRAVDGKDIVNKVKGREWFRPFAGSMLKEYANEWFDMAGLEESPFMMYAVDVLPHQKDKVPCITHVDGTCRIQTVTQEQNKYYYDLISSFHKLTGVPILFNTSFNLAGEPLVETFEDALRTLKNSKLEYLYVPSKGILLQKNKEE